MGVLSEMWLPHRTEVRGVLESLEGGRTTPGEAAAWADRWVSADDVPEGDDVAVWEALTRLAGADLECAPGKLLHGEDDFAAWLADFAAVTPTPPPDRELLRAALAALASGRRTPLDVAEWARRVGLGDGPVRVAVLAMREADRETGLDTYLDWLAAFDIVPS